MNPALDSPADPPVSTGHPDHGRSGPTIEDAIATAEAGSAVEGVHTLDGSGPSGASRIEQLPAVAGITEGRLEGAPDEHSTTPGPGPSPTDIGSGGAQRIAGARISDRIAAGEPVPDGPPFDTQSSRD